MIIVSDCIKDNLDEGCIKVASTLAKRLAAKGNKLVAVNCECSYADKSLNANKIYSNKELYSFISDNDGDILFIPFASNTLGTAVRTWNLSRKSGRRVLVLFALRWPMSIIKEIFLKLSGCSVLTLSQDSFFYFKKSLKGITVDNLKIGVDTERFVPVDDEKKMTLRAKYGLPQDKTIILHVGHLKHGRNVDVFLDLDEKYHGVLVFSSITEKDNELKRSLENKPNITIIESYCSNIEELYQLSDIYVFPVVDQNNNIDIPLSVLEAASCNIRIIATKNKEIAYFKDAPGLLRVDNGQLGELNSLINELLSIKEVKTRDIALEYDWNHGIGIIECLGKE